MKQIHRATLCFATAVLLCFSLATAGEMTVKFREITSWQQVLDIAKAENKHVFVDAYTDWCHWCKVMDKETFTDAAVGKVMNDNFIAVKIEMESGWGVDVAMKYGVRGFPTFLVLSADGRLVQRLVGYMPPASFIPELQKSIDPAQQEVEPGYKAGVTPNWPEFMRPVFVKAKERKQPDTAVVNGWLRAQKDWSTEEAWGVIHAFNPAIANDYVVEHRTALAKSYGSNVSNVLDGMVRKKVFKAAKDQNEELFGEAIALKHKLSEGDISGDSVVFRLSYYQSGKNWSKLASTLVTGIKEGYIGLGQVNQFAWEMYENCDDKAALTQATEAMNIGIQKENGGYAELDTYAALLYKTQCYPQAEQAATKAIEAGKLKGEDVAGTQELLGKIKEKQGNSEKQK